jgi:YVTN family beta-propeller protein
VSSTAVRFVTPSARRALFWLAVLSSVSAALVGGVAGSATHGRAGASGVGAPRVESSGSHSPLAAGSSDVGPRVVHTLVLANNTLISGNFLAASGQRPLGAAYDPLTHEMFVVDQGEPGSYNGSGVSVVDDTTNHVVAFVPLGETPSAILFDPARDRLFVANSASGNVSIVDPGTDSVVKVLTVGASPCALAYDSANGNVFVANCGSTSLSEFNNTTGSVQTPGAVLPSDPDALAYDPATDELLVASPGAEPLLDAGSVSVVNASNGSVVRTVPVGLEPSALVWDSTDNRSFIANEASDNVTVLSGTNLTNSSSIPTGVSPVALALDASTYQLFVANEGGSNLTVIDAQSNSTYWSVPLPTGPSGIAFDPDSGVVYATLENVSLVDAIDAAAYESTALIPVGSGPAALALDNTTAALYVSDASADELDTVSVTENSTTASTDVGFAPAGLSFDPAQAEVFVGNSGPPAPSQVAIFNVSQSAVVGNITTPSNPVASVYDSARGDLYTANSAVGSVSVIDAATDHLSVSPQLHELEPTALAYDPALGEIFVADEGSATVSVISDTSRDVTEEISVGEQPDAVAYDPNTGDVFVADFGSNNVSVISAASNSVVKTIAVGGGPSALAFDGYNDEMFVANELSGTLSSISDASLTVVGSTTVGRAPGALAYDPTADTLYVANLWAGTLSIVSPGGVNLNHVEFTETGLPAGTEWAVTLNGTLAASSLATLSFSEPFGTYPWNASGFTTNSTIYTVAPASGNVTVGLGAPVGVALVFTAAEFAVVFSESGLPSGTEWNATLGNSEAYFSTPTFTFYEPDGTYNFSVGNASGYYPVPANGTVTVDQKSQPVNILYFPNSSVAYGVTFLESGLSSGAEWWVNLTRGPSFPSTAQYVTFHLPNGTYGYTASAVGSKNVSGTLVVAGPPSTPVQISFVPASSPTSAPGPGLSTTDAELLGFGVVLAVLAGVTAAVLWIGRKRRAESPNAGGATDPEDSARFPPNIRPSEDEEADDEDEPAFGTPDRSYDADDFP